MLILVRVVQAVLFCVVVVAARPARSQAIAQDVIIDNDFPVGEPLEKVIDYFTSAAFPSVIVGNGRGGIYLYRSVTDQLQGPWQRSVIAKRGSAYERARSIKLSEDTHPGVVASIGNQVVVFENPKNRRRDAAVTQPWPAHVINPNHGCHDIRVEDIDGDGKVDIVCSAAVSLRAPPFIAFQNDRNHWQLVYDIADVGDDIAVLRIGDDTLPHLVGATGGPAGSLDRASHRPQLS